MSTVTMAPIVCAGCNRKFAWKPELAGKRVKCKCGQAISVRAAEGQAGPAKPVAPKPPKPVKHVEPDEMGLGLDGLFALAEDADRAAAAAPIEVREAPVPVLTAEPKRSTAAGIPLAYKRGPSAQQRNQTKTDTFVEPVRDLYVPSALVGSGLLIYLAFYAVRLNLGTTGMAVVGTGLVLLTILKTVFMIGAAFLLAGPLNVGFGTLWTAVLKLAAVAVFTDGVTAWIDYALQLGGAGVGNGGLIGFSSVSWLCSVLMYWGLMVYLFSMDFHDARLVTVCLGIMSRVVRMLLIAFAFQWLFSMGGVGAAAAAAAGVAGPQGSSSVATAVKSDELSVRIDEMRDAGQLNEARKYIASGFQLALKPSVDAWYAAGCKDVSFEMSGADINGRRTLEGLVVQLPTDLARRAQCYTILKQYYDSVNVPVDPIELKDTGESYMEVELRL